jgi:hypothetical protein
MIKLLFLGSVPSFGIRPLTNLVTLTSKNCRSSAFGGSGPPSDDRLGSLEERQLSSPSRPKPEGQQTAQSCQAATHFEMTSAASC